MLNCNSTKFQFKVSSCSLFKSGLLSLCLILQGMRELYSKLKSKTSHIDAIVLGDPFTVCEVLNSSDDDLHCQYWSDDAINPDTHQISQRCQGLCWVEKNQLCIELLKWVSYLKRQKILYYQRDVVKIDFLIKLNTNRYFLEHKYLYTSPIWRYNKSIYPECIESILRGISNINPAEIPSTTPLLPLPPPWRMSARAEN